MERALRAGACRVHVPASRLAARRCPALCRAVAAPPAVAAPLAEGVYTAATEAANAVLLEVRSVAKDGVAAAATGGYVCTLEERDGGAATLTPLRADRVPAAVWKKLTGIAELRDELNAAVERPPPSEAARRPVELTGLTPVRTLAELKDAVADDASPWAAGNLAEQDGAEGALLAAGELLALREGARGVVLVQAFNANSDAPSPMFDPLVLEALRECAEDSDVSLKLSVAVGAGDSIDGFTLAVHADRAPFTQYAEHLCSLGVQAQTVANGPYYKALIGTALGYAPENVRAHAAKYAEAVTDEVEAEVATALLGVSDVAPALPWRSGAPKAIKGGFGKRSGFGGRGELSQKAASKGSGAKKAKHKGKTLRRK